MWQDRLCKILDEKSINKLKNSTVLIIGLGGVGGSALKLRAVSDDLMRTRTLIAEILSKHSGHDIEEIYNKTATDTYFYGQEAVDYGLADNVITSI